jgi:hypothetical protein
MRTFNLGGAASSASVAPRAHAASVCHSGSLFDVQCLPPSWCGSPPAASASGCRSKRLPSGSPGKTRALMSSKFLRASASLQVAAPSASGCKRIVVPDPWHEMQRALPSRFVVRIGWMRALKYS